MNNQSFAEFLLPYFFLILFPLLGITQSFPIDSLQQVLKDSDDDKEKVDALVYLTYYNVNSDAEKALAYANEGLALAHTINYSKGLLQLYLQMAGIHATTGQFNLAVEILDTSEPLALEKKDTQNLLKIYKLRAAYESVLGNLDKAVLVALKHLELAEKTGNIAEKAGAFSNLGYLNGDTGKQDYPKALDYFKQAAQIYESLNDSSYHAFALLNVSAIYQSLENFEESKNTAEHAIEISEKLRDNDMLVSLYAILGTNYYKLKQKEVAIAHLQKSVDLSKKTSNTDEQTKWTLKLIEYLNEAKAYDKALFYLSEAANLMESQDRISYKFTYFEQLAIAQKGKGFYEDAFEHYELAMSWKDSAYQEKKLKEFDEIQTKYETEKKEQENQFLTQQNDFLATRNHLYTFIGIGLVAIIMILIWLFYQIRKSKIQLEEQNQVINTQKIQLENLNATKDQFFAIIAHDMRNAVFSFRGISKKVSFLIKTNQLQRLQDIGSGIDEAVNNLTNLLNNLLEWALLQKGSIPYDPIAINVSAIITEVLDIAKSAAEAKDIELINKITPDIAVFADRNALATIIRNLVSNAIKFTHEGGKITISTKNIEDKTFIEINDTGTGISAQRLEKLFEVDKKKVTKGTAGEKGSGLGLLLVKELVEVNKGSIEVFSNLGKGATFTFSMPSA